MKLIRMEVVRDLGIYGKSPELMWGFGGLATFRRNDKSWGIYHVASGAEVTSRISVPTRKAALARMEALLALPVKWGKEDPGLHDVVSEIRAIAALKD